MFSCNARDKNEKEKIQTSHKYRFQTRLCWQSFRSLGIISGGDVNCLRLSEKGAKKEKKTSSLEGNSVCVTKKGDGTWDTK
jgi:hypothetical protein